MKNNVLFSEGLPALLVVILLSVILYFIYPWLSLFGIGLIMFVIYFFRDPIREAPVEEQIILAPADGIVTEIFETEEKLYMGQRVIGISIFMSPLDVHINRSPIMGQVEWIEHKKGKFRPAKNPDHFIENEKNYIGIKNDQIQVLVVQIAGIMARRIVNWTYLGQLLEQGEKIGMIKFSSGSQIYLPLGTELLVKKGDRVLSGKTVIGRY